jgi:hypothetical protein
VWSCGCASCRDQTAVECGRDWAADAWILRSHAATGIDQTGLGMVGQISLGMVKMLDVGMVELLGCCRVNV